MLRGLLAGGVWGAVIAVVVLALTSQIADWRDLTPAITEDVASADPGVAMPAAPIDAPGTTPSADSPITESILPSVTPGDADAVASPALETAPPGAPSAPDAIASPNAPAAETDMAAAPAPETDVATAALTPAAPAPDLPRAVPKPEPLVRNRVSTGDTPTAPVAPVVADAPETPQDSTAPQLAQRSVARPAPIETETATLPDAESAAPVPQAPVVAEATVPEATEDATRPAAMAETSPAPAPAPAAPQRPAEDAVALADITPAAPAQPAQSRVRETQRVTTIRVNQLPTISAPAPASEAQTDTAATPDPGPANAAEAALAAQTADTALPGEVASSLPGETSEAALPGQTVSGLPGESVASDDTVAARPTEFEMESLSDLAIVRNSVAFTAEPDQPLLSVIMVDTGDGQLDTNQIEELPFHITLGIDAAADNARDLAQGYRAAGSEVALIPTLPIDGRAQDLAMALSFNKEAVPVAVAIMDATGSDFQTDRTATTEVVAAAAASGHGIVTHSRGLNSSRNIAVQAGVPAGQVFRVIDPELSDIRAIGRFLDQAAFRARRDGSVILVMPARQDMLNALVAWSFQPRASTITLAPLSAILRGGGV